MGRKQHQGDKLWLTTQEWKYFFGGKKPGRKADPDEVAFSPVLRIRNELFMWLYFISEKESEKQFLTHKM
jgi:hypothetical protein